MFYLHFFTWLNIWLLLRSEHLLNINKDFKSFNFWGLSIFVDSWIHFGIYFDLKKCSAVFLTQIDENDKIFFFSFKLVHCLIAYQHFLGYYFVNNELSHSHHHHIVSPARISLTLSRHFSLSFIASGWSSALHPVSSPSCCVYVLAGRPAFAQPYVGVHWSTSLMSSSLLLQQCPACLVRLTWIVFVMGGRWPYSWCFVGCCLQGLFNIARSILV